MLTEATNWLQNRRNAFENFRLFREYSRLFRNEEYVPVYLAKGIANHFLDKSDTVTPTKIQTLIYMAHGWYLLRCGNPLVIERVEAWVIGPLIP